MSPLQLVRKRCLQLPEVVQLLLKIRQLLLKALQLLLKALQLMQRALQLVFSFVQLLTERTSEQFAASTRKLTTSQPGVTGAGPQNPYFAISDYYFTKKENVF